TGAPPPLGEHRRASVRRAECRGANRGALEHSGGRAAAAQRRATRCRTRRQSLTLFARVVVMRGSISRTGRGKMLFRRTLETMQCAHRGKPFEMVFWNGERWRFGAGAGDPEFVLHFKTRTSFVRSVLQTTLGLGESYVTGEVAVEGSLEDVL